MALTLTVPDLDGDLTMSGADWAERDAEGGSTR